MPKQQGASTTQSVPSYIVRVHMSGDIDTAKRWLRQECWREGLCVTVEPVTFIYTGGEAPGFVVGFVNYPRFPSAPVDILCRARLIAVALVAECAQRSALLVAPDVTEWITREIPRDLSKPAPVHREEEKG